MTHRWTRRSAGAALLGALALTVTPNAALARAGRLWRVDPNASRIAFLYTADGAEEEGRFERFRASGFFAPERLETTELTLAIETASIDLDDGFRTGLATSEAWFDVEHHPTAEFRLTRLSRVEGARCRAEGMLAIKGIERPLAVDLDLSFDRSEARAVGEVAFNRLDFTVGDNAASFFIDIGEMVSVRFDLVAHPA